MKKFTLFNLFPDELMMVSQRILKFLALFVQDEPALKAGHNVISRKTNELKRSFTKDKKSRYTIKLLEKDVVRDDAFIWFRDHIKSFLKSPDQLKREAANQVIDKIRKHGYSLHYLSNIRQSAAMSSLIAELKEPLNLQLIIELGADAHFEAMDKAAVEYEVLREEKVDEETQKEYAQIYKVFRELSGDLKDLIKYVVLINKDNYRPEQLPNIISSIEKEVTDAMATANSRKTRKESSKPAA